MDRDNYKINNAQVVFCRCHKNKQPFGIRIEEVKPREWCMTWAFAINERISKREGYGETTIKGGIYNTDAYPGCPYCGNSGFFRCGACGKATCYNGTDSEVTCAHCGRTSKISGVINELKVGNDR